MPSDRTASIEPKDRNARFSEWHSEKLHSLDRAVYGDPPNGVKRLLERVTNLETWWHKALLLFVLPSVIAALVAFALSRVF